MGGTGPKHPAPRRVRYSAPCGRPLPRARAPMAERSTLWCHAPTAVLRVAAPSRGGVMSDQKSSSGGFPRRTPGPWLGSGEGEARRRKRIDSGPRGGSVTNLAPRRTHRRVRYSALGRLSPLPIAPCGTREKQKMLWEYELKLAQSPNSLFKSEIHFSTSSFRILTASVSCLRLSSDLGSE